MLSLQVLIQNITYSTVLLNTKYMFIYQYTLLSPLLYDGLICEVNWTYVDNLSVRVSGIVGWSEVVTKQMFEILVRILHASNYKIHISTIEIWKIRFSTINYVKYVSLMI